MKKAKAAIMTAVNQPFEIMEFPITGAPAGMAGMKLLVSGVCGTDIHIHRGKIPLNTPAMIGHEFIGEVDDISEEDSKASGIAIGDRVIVDIASPCGECLLCREGDDANCVHMGVTNGGNPLEAPHFFGGYGEYNYTPVANLVKIPDGLPAMAVGAFACPGPTAIHAFRLGKEAGLDLARIHTAVVQGFGPVGCFAAMYLAAMGVPEVIAVTADPDGSRTRMAEKLGVHEVMSFSNRSMESILDELKAKNDGLGVDLVVECSGNPKAVPQGMQILRNRGIYLIPGQYSNSGPIEIQPQMITFNALRLIGSSQYSLIDVRDYLAFLSEHKELLPAIENLVTGYRVEDINRAYEDAKAGKNIKTVLIP